MPVDLPEYYFRVKDNGATVFRVEAENRQKRLELTTIANVNVRNGEIKPQGQHVLTDAETNAIEEWKSARQAELAGRDFDTIRRTEEQLNLTTHWAQSRATPEQLDEVTDRLLLAMHDLRTVLVRKKANRIDED
jgi:hypothetical protein